MHGRKKKGSDLRRYTYHRHIKIAVFSFVAILVIASASYLFLQNQASDAKKIFDSLESKGGKFQIIDGNVVDVKKALNLDYDALRQDNNVDSDIIVYFENAEGNLIGISGNFCFGSSTMSVEGVPCKSK